MARASGEGWRGEGGFGERGIGHVIRPAGPGAELGALSASPRDQPQREARPLTTPACTAHGRLQAVYHHSQGRGGPAPAPACCGRRLRGADHDLVGRGVPAVEKRVFVLREAEGGAAGLPSPGAVLVVLSTRVDALKNTSYFLHFLRLFEEKRPREAAGHKVSRSTEPQGGRLRAGNGNCDTPPQLLAPASGDEATGKMSARAAQIAGTAEARRPGSPKARKRQNRSPRQICKVASGVGCGASVCDQAGRIPLDVAESKKRLTAIVLLEGRGPCSTMRAETPQESAERPERRPPAAEIQQAKGGRLRTPPPSGPTEGTSAPGLPGRKRPHPGAVVVAIPPRSRRSHTRRFSPDARTESPAAGSPSPRRSPRKRQPASVLDTAVRRSDSEPSDSGEVRGPSELADPSYRPGRELDVDVRQNRRALHQQRRAPRRRSQKRKPAGSTGKIADRLGAYASGATEAAFGAKAEDTAFTRPS
ncbi:MAG: hypothetical protein BJ554DRAFT_7590, partial [Olpidium bornovanus]